MQKITAIIFSAITLLFSFSAQADTNPYAKWYQVELIVFSHITAQGLNSERWSWTNPQFVAKSQAFEPTMTNDLKLKSEEAHIEKQPGYKVLMHVAWRQQIQHPRYARPIHIFGGNVYSASGKILATDADGQMKYNNQHVWQVNGTIKISVRRYFDLNANLLFALPTDQLNETFKDNSSDNLQGHFAYFRLLQSRRMRSKELNYIGHPLYGLLLKVTPLDIKETT